MNEFRALQEECFHSNLALPAQGLTELTFGNVSVADWDRGIFAIKPSGVDYAALRAEDIVVLDLASGQVLAGGMRPSSDTPTHRRLLQAFGAAGIRAIAHTHSRNAVAWAQAGRTIPCLGTTHADYFYGEIPVTRPMTPEEISAAYEWETANVIVESFQQLDPAEMCAVLVHGHGPFVWGRSGKEAVEAAVALEIVAGMAALALQINPAAAPISPALLEKHFRRKHGPSAYYGQPG
jgi:L-ribulose-5-phosphate 4-epimerase